MESYSYWVRRNHQWLASIESLANTLTWLIPERLASSELVPEAVATTVGLVTVLNRHIVETDPRSIPRSRGGENERLPWPVFVSVMKELEVLVELTAEHYRGADGKWSVLAVVEVIKVLLRLKVFHDSGYKMLIEGGETENQPDSTVPSHCDPRAQCSNPRQQTQSQGRALEAFRRFGSAVPVTPSWVQARKEQHPVPSIPDFRMLWNQPLSRLFIFGEVTSILRPLIYVLLIRKYGLKSWKPWLASLAIDLTSFSIFLYKDSLQKKITIGPDNPHGTPSGPLSSAEKDELKRRQLLLAFYLLRSPFFDRYPRPLINGIENQASRLPLFGALTSKAVELLKGVQSIYSYTSAS